MIKNYIFDFGNVLANFYPDKLTEPFVEDKEKYISEIVFDRIYWDRLDEGTITEDEVKSAIRERLPKETGDRACKVFDNWINTITPVKNMKELICDIHKSGKKLYLLSNISIRFANSYNEVEWIKELFEYFDGLVFSGPIGLVKPGKEIFEHLLGKYDLKADECLFIDDNEKNIEGAKAVGINGYLFDGDAAKLREYIDIF